MKRHCLLFALILGLLPLTAQDFIQSSFQNKFVNQFTVADFDGDGDVDVFGIDLLFNGPSDIYLYRNRGTNPIDFEVIKLEEDGTAIGQPAAADMDGDGDIDVIMNRGEDLAIVLQSNNGDGTFEEMPLGIGGAEELKIIDVESDGDLDLVGINTNLETITIFINDGQLNFSMLTAYTSDNDLERFDVADLNNDGLVDLVLGVDDFFDDQVIYLQNGGANIFEATPLIADVFERVADVLFADFNKDGLLDIGAINNKEIAIWTQSENATFDRQDLSEYTRQSPLGFGFLDVADFNGDGVLDLLVGDGEEGTIWYENTATTPLNYERRQVGTVVGGGVNAAEDLDLDGDLDIILSNGDIWWYENSVEQQTTPIFSIQSSDWQIYPNPFQDHLSLKGLAQEDLKIEMYTIFGQRVLESTIVNSKIDVSHLEKGVYLLKVKKEDSQQLLEELVLKVN